MRFLGAITNRASGRGAAQTAASGEGKSKRHRSFFSVPASPPALICRERPSCLFQPPRARRRHLSHQGGTTRGGPGGA